MPEPSDCADNAEFEMLDAAPKPTWLIPVVVLEIVAVAATLPLFLKHLQHLSHIPHRAHFTLIVAGFLAVVWQRHRSAKGPANHRLQPTDILVLALSLASFTGATMIGSPWLGTLSLIFVVAVLLRRLPSVDNVGYFGPWVLLFLLLPLPLGLDQELVRGLQSFATRASSRLLDLAGINHLMSGNVLEVPSQQLFIDEACAGIQSLFAMITCVALFAVWTRRPAILAVPLLLASVLMCAVVNILRIAIVVWGEKNGLDLATGWAHEVLGAVMFALALWLVYCSEGCVLFLLGPIVDPATGMADNRIAGYWNNMTRTLHASVYGVVVNDQPVRRRFLRFSLPGPVGRMGLFLATVAFAFLGIAGTAGGAAARDTILRQRETEMLVRSDQVDEQLLPAEQGSWKRIGMRRRDRKSERASGSVTWDYQSPYYQVAISLDYPFYGSHNVSDCYHMTGWNVVSRREMPDGFFKAALERPGGHSAWLYYEVFDADGNIAVENAIGRLDERIRQFDGRKNRPTWQIQMLVESHYGLTVEDILEIELNFRALRTRLRTHISGQTKEGPQP